MKIVASCRLQLHGTAVWVDHMTTVIKLFQVQCHVLAVVPAAAAIPYVTCVRDSPDQTLVGLLLHPALLLPFKKETREDKNEPAPGDGRCKYSSGKINGLEKCIGCGVGYR